MKTIQFTSRRTDLKVLAVVGIIGAAVIAVTALRFWALPVLNISGSYVVPPNVADEDASNAYIIRNYWPHRLIQPAWVSNTPDLFINWSHAEATARVAVVGIVWLIVTVGLIYMLIKLQKPPPPDKLMG